MALPRLSLCALIWMQLVVLAPANASSDTENSTTMAHASAPSSLTGREAASGVLGSISVAAWIFVIVPQLIENYRASSAAAISVPFLLIWFVGDALNFAGAAWAGLVPTAIVLGAYFCLADVFLISQCLYYNLRDRRRRRAESGERAPENGAPIRSGTAVEDLEAVLGSEQEPLLHEQRSKLDRRASTSSRGSNMGMPGSHVPFFDVDDTSHPSFLQQQHAHHRHHGQGHGHGHLNPHDTQRRRSSGGRSRPELGERAQSGTSSLGKIDEREEAGSGPTVSQGQEQGWGPRRSGTGTSPAAVVGIRAVFSRRNLKLLARKAALVLVICGLGTVGWGICYATGLWMPQEVAGLSFSKTSSAAQTQADTEEKRRYIGAETLGYASAVLYLGARIPQIVKNWRDKSCDGLSSFFFLLSLIGNLTYGAGILAHSTEPAYIALNLPWLIGSLGTIVEDCTIFVQFHIYGAAGEDGEDGKRSEHDNALGQLDEGAGEGDREDGADLVVGRAR